MNFLLFTIALLAVSTDRVPVRIDLVHEMYGVYLASEMKLGLNHKPLFGAPTGTMIVDKVSYRRVGEKYHIRSRLVTCAPGRLNSGAYSIPTFTDQLIGVRVTYSDGSVCAKGKVTQ